MKFVLFIIVFSFPSPPKRKRKIPGYKGDSSVPRLAQLERSTGGKRISDDICTSASHRRFSPLEVFVTIEMHLFSFFFQ